MCNYSGQLQASHTTSTTHVQGGDLADALHIYQAGKIVLKNFPSELACSIFSQAEIDPVTKVGTTTWRIPEMTTLSAV